MRWAKTRKIYKWFAWYPVYAEDTNESIWLEVVKVYRYINAHNEYLYTYRPIDTPLPTKGKKE